MCLVSTEVAWAYSLAKAKLKHALPRRWGHVRGAARQAQELSRLFPVDGELLVCAAVLHDIGYSPDLAILRFHPLDGARYLNNRGASRRLCALVAHHSCAYIEAELRGLSLELSEWDDEHGPLRDALWWIDMTTAPDGEAISFARRIDEIKSRYGSGDLVTEFIQRAEPELRAAVERTEERLRAAGLGHLAK
jgi:hypothetical protein